jgi:twitching motility two-component system response regulator PilH
MGGMSTAYAAPVRSSPSPRRRSAAVLLIDDDRSYLEMVTLKLELEGHIVVTATDGAEGLELARRQLPDIIFLDAVLSGIDGLDLLTRLKADQATRDIPVVVVSGHCERLLIENCRRLGAIDYLVKSMSVPATLSYAVESYGRVRSAAA